MGILLLLLGIYYISQGGQKTKWGFLCYILIVTSGMNLIPPSFFFFKTDDTALIFAIFSWFFTRHKHTAIGNCDYKILSALKLFLIFLVCSAIFSVIYYGLTPFDVIQGGRKWFVVLIYYSLRKLSTNDIKWLINKVFVLTAINGVLYLIQVLTGLHVLPYDVESNIQNGVVRYYNTPIFINFYIAILLFFPSILKIKSRYIMPISFILIVDVMLSQNRTALAAVLFSIFLGFLIKGSLSKVSRYFIIGSFVCLPFLSLVLDRFQSADNYGFDTKSDIANIFQGNFVSYENGHDGGTMTFRFAYVYERAAYLLERPLPETLFGMGMVSDSNPWVSKKYKFWIGNYREDLKRVPYFGNWDIAYGIIIPCLGFLGGFIFLRVWYLLTKLSFTKRRVSDYSLAFYLQLVALWITSIAGSNMAFMSMFTVVLLYSLLLYEDSFQTINKSL